MGRFVITRSGTQASDRCHRKATKAASKARGKRAITLHNSAYRRCMAAAKTTKRKRRK